MRSLNSVNMHYFVRIRQCSVFVFTTLVYNRGYFFVNTVLEVVALFDWTVKKKKMACVAQA